MDGGADPTAGAPRDSPFLGITFECCSVYYRIYRNADGTAYEGRCPRCASLLCIPVGPDGTPNRFFRAG